MAPQQGLTDFSLVPCEKSAFVRPLSLLFNHDGKKRRWDVVDCYDAAGVLVYNTDRHAFVLVRQFRPAVFYSQQRSAFSSNGSANKFSEGDKEKGFTLEVCAGLLDKPDLSVPQVLREECMEECGYDVDPSDFELVNVCLGSVGTQGNSIHYYYVEVRDHQRVGEGGGIDDESIEVVHLPAAEAVSFVSDHTRRPTGLFYLMEWWLHRKGPRYGVSPLVLASSPRPQVAFLLGSLLGVGVGLAAAAARR